MFRVLQSSVQKPVEYKNTVNKYGYYLDDEKKRVFGVIGSTDFVEFINSHLAQCDYSQIMSTLMPSTVEFDDFDGILALEEKINDPNDGLYYMSLLQDEFNKLPLEVKEKYGKDFSVFTRDFISGGFANYVAEKYKLDESSESNSPSSNGTASPDERVAGFDRELRELIGRFNEFQGETAVAKQSASQNVNEGNGDSQR